VDIGGKQRAGEIAEVFDAVHIGKGAGNENPGHGSILSRKGMPNPVNQKALPRDRKGLDSACALARKTRALSRPV
jgi:hypothetical protein